MKTFFRFFTVLAVLALFTISASAQLFQARDFLTVPAVNCGTNLVGATNGASLWSGISFTNAAGTRMYQTNGVVSDTATANINLFADVALYSDRDGNAIWGQYPTTSYEWSNAVTHVKGQLYTPIGGQNISVTFNGLNANFSSGNVTFEFIPLPDGVNPSTTAGDIFAFAVAVNGVTPVTFSTNFPSWKYAGVKKLRLNKIYSSEADHGGMVTSVKLNGFVP